MNWTKALMLLVPFCRVLLVPPPQPVPTTEEVAEKIAAVERAIDDLQEVLVEPEEGSQ